MRALVTGAGGFLGRYISEQLRQRGDQVRAFSRRDNPELATLGIDCIRGDLRDANAVSAACQDVDVVFHVGAIAGIWGPWQVFHDTNVLGTRHVIDGCLRHSVKRLVYTSSPSVIFDGHDQRGVDESVGYPDQWLCHYPHTKAIAEKMVLQANSNRLLTCSLRPHLIWGPRDEHLIPRLLDRARRGQLRQIGDGANQIDMIYVENAAAAHLNAADRLVEGSSVPGRAYFLSQGEPVNCWDWINDVIRMHGLAPVRKRISFEWAWRLGAGLELTYRCLPIPGEPRMTRFLAAQLARDHYYDIRRARTDLDYRPHVSTSEGMERLAACQCREN